MGQSTGLATSITPYRATGAESMAAAAGRPWDRTTVTSSATLTPRHDELPPPDRLGVRFFSLQLLMQVLPAQRGDEER